MTDPKRWDLVDQGDTALTERPDGDYVRWEDYQVEMSWYTNYHRESEKSHQRKDDEITQLRGNLSLAEDGLASAAQQIIDFENSCHAMQAQIERLLPFEKAALYVQGGGDLAGLIQQRDHWLDIAQGKDAEIAELKRWQLEARKLMNAPEPGVCPGCNRKGEIHAPWCAVKSADALRTDDDPLKPPEQPTDVDLLAEMSIAYQKISANQTELDPEAKAVLYGNLKRLYRR